MLGRIRSQCQCLQKKGQNSNVRKDKIRIPMFKKKGQNSNDRKDKITMPMFTKIGPEFQC